MAKVTVKRSQREGFLDGIAGNFEIAIDRGETSSPRSIELVLLGLGSCTISAVQNYLVRKGMPVDGLAVEVTSELNAATNAYGDFKISLTLDERFTPAEREIILGIAKSCRIHKTLTSGLEIALALAAPAAGSTV